jgi:hypothetical protein
MSQLMVIVTVRGDDREQLLKAYDAIADYEEEHVPGLSTHVCAVTEEGIKVVGLWASREAYEALSTDERFAQVRAASGMPPAEFEVLEVYRARE